MCLYGVGCREEAYDKGISPSLSVSISTPFSVHRRVCSHCADKLLSFVTTVQSSLSVFVNRLPMLIIGSMVNVSPGIRVISGMLASS